MRLLIGSAIACALFGYGIAFANIINSSVNQPTFPPAGLSLLKTIPAQSGGARNAITIQNQSTDTIQVWRDTACTGTQLSEIVLAGAGVSGGQGQAWSSDTFAGCIRIYGVAGDQVSAWQD